MSATKTNQELANSHVNNKAFGSFDPEDEEDEHQMEDFVDEDFDDDFDDDDYYDDDDF